MTRFHQFSILMVLIIAANWQLVRSAPPDIKLDGQLQLGQGQVEVREILNKLGYTEDLGERQHNRMLFLKEGLDEWRSPMIRVSLSANGKVVSLSGRMQEIQISDRLIITNETTKQEIDLALGKPSWESRMKSPVFENAYGMCYESLELYILLCNGKAISFSWGVTPPEPSTLYVQP
jgi:hypothetical protein